MTTSVRGSLNHAHEWPGRVDPVPFYVKNDLTGLGKANQDVRMSECMPTLSRYCSQRVRCSRNDGFATAGVGFRAADKRDGGTTQAA